MNNASILQQPDDDRRGCERFDLHQQIQLELDGGDNFEGNTANISLSGMLLQTDITPEHEIQNLTGMLYLVRDGRRRSDGYPCRVVRLVNQCIALELERRTAAAFGMRLTKDLLKIS